MVTGTTADADSEIILARRNTMEDAIHSGMTPATMTIIPANSIDMEIISTISQGTMITIRQDTGIIINLNDPVL